MKSLKSLVILSIIGLLAGVGCTDSSSTNNCTSGSTSSGCQVPTTSGSSTALQIQFVDSYFNDPNSSTTWTTISASNLNAGTIPNLNVYPSYNTLSIAASLSDAAAALTQRSNSVVTDINQTPYIEFVAQVGTSYAYQYNIITKVNGVSKTTQGAISSVSILPGTTRAIIPLSSAFLSNLYFGQSAQQNPGTIISGQLSITASSNTQSSAPVSISFSSVYSLQNRTYLMSVADAMKNFTIENRWSSYYTSGTTPQTNLPIVVAKDISGKSANPTNLMVKFCGTKPSISIDQTMFFELPFDGIQFQNTGVVVPNRGNTFYTNNVKLDTINDFKIKVSIGGQPINPKADNNTDYYLPPSTTINNFDITFAADFTPTSSYSLADPNGKGLLFPLKPVCQEIKDEAFSPLANAQQGAAALAAGAVQRMTCDLDTTTTNKTYTYDQLQGLSPAPMDTWYDNFSYAPMRLSRKELGHLYGIKQITFTVAAAFKLIVLDSNGNPQLDGAGKPIVYSEGGNSCNGDGSTDWTVINKSLTYTIFDNVAGHASIPGLPGILNLFNSSTTQTYPKMKINNENLDANAIRHIY